MATYILNERDEAVSVTWTEYAEWYHEHKDSLVIAHDDIRSGKGKYMTTVITKFRGVVDNPTDPPLVWIIETIDGDLFGCVATRKEAYRDHKRYVRMLKDCYCSK
jgi:hypothetical protein